MTRLGVCGYSGVLTFFICQNIMSFYLLNYECMSISSQCVGISGGGDMEDEPGALEPLRITAVAGALFSLLRR